MDKQNQSKRYQYLPLLCEGLIFVVYLLPIFKLLDGEAFLYNAVSIAVNFELLVFLDNFYPLILLILAALTFGLLFYAMKKSPRTQQKMKGFIYGLLILSLILFFFELNDFPDQTQGVAAIAILVLSLGAIISFVLLDREVTKLLAKEEKK